MKLAGQNPSKFAHPDLPESSTEAPPSLAWRFTYVPSRLTNPSIPKLRLLLPLTEAYEREESKSSSLLAVFDDVFYDEAGLGDTLEAEIESIPVEKTNPKEFVIQAGKDTLLRGKDPQSGDPEKPASRVTKMIPLPESNSMRRNPRRSGPGTIGNYRDMNNRYARFLATSFIVPAPTRTDGKPLDARGWLASIRFRRSVRTREFPAAVPQSTALKDYSGSGLLEWDLKTRPSG